MVGSNSCVLPRVLRGLVASVLLSSLGTAQAPALRHSAPFLGRELRLVLEGAPPSAVIELFEGPLRDHVATPFGVWELERTAMHRVAVGFADATGRFVHAWNVPLHMPLAEKPLHYQALVRAPGATLLSEAVHLRLIGARAYVSSYGASTPNGLVPGSLTIASLVSNRRVAQIDYELVASGPALGAQPVFNANYSRGAVLASERDLSFFDPFFGIEHARRPLPRVSARLTTSPDGETVYALAPGDFATSVPAVVHGFRLVDASPAASLTLPLMRRTGQWIANLSSSHAYAVGRDDAAGQLFVERIELDSASSSGALAIAPPGFTEVTDMTASERSVWLLVRREVFIGAWEGVLTRIEEGAGASVTVTPWLGTVRSITAAPQVGAFAALSAPSMWPGASLLLSRLGSPTDPAYFMAGLHADSAYRAIPVRTGVFLHTWTNDWSGHELNFVNYATRDWFTIPLGDYPPQIVDIAAFDDPNGERACALVREFECGAPWCSARATLYVFSQTSSATAPITVGPGPHGLLAVPNPWAADG